MEITIDNFIECWKKFALEYKKEILDVYDKPAKRTHLIIGSKRSSQEDSLLGNFMKRFYSDEFDYRCEDGSVDLSFYKKDFLENIKDMQDESKVNNLKEKDLQCFPKYYDIIIEHENVIERAYEEMHKLTYFNSQLKVLITYIWDPDKKGNQWNYAHDRLCNNFEAIIKQANARFPENGENDYLLITCQRINGELRYRFSSFNTFSMVNLKFVVVNRIDVWNDLTT